MIHIFSLIIAIFIIVKFELSISKVLLLSLLPSLLFTSYGIILMALDPSSSLTTGKDLGVFVISMTFLSYMWMFPPLIVISTTFLAIEQNNMLLLRYKLLVGAILIGIFTYLYGITIGTSQDIVMILGALLLGLTSILIMHYFTSG